MATDEEIVHLYSVKGWTKTKIVEDKSVTIYRVNKALKASNTPKQDVLSTDYIVGLLETGYKKDKFKLGQEKAVAKKLFDLFPDIRFWKELKIKEKVYTLRFFSSESMLAELKRIWNSRNIVLPKADKIDLSEEKIGEDLKIDIKPKTIYDFLTNE